MGYGSYRATDWSKLKESRGINSTSEVKDLFAEIAQEKYIPRFFDKRESFDSEDAPNSTPIIIAFDDTGSMGYLAQEIATNSLNRTILEIYDKKPVTNPHVCCATFGNKTDNVPLQVTQFEADIRIAEQLLEFYIEGHGNGYSGDPYVWYFAAKHTQIDCFDKRQKKGFLFTIGDDFCKSTHTKGMEKWDVENVFGDKINTDLITSEQAYKMACEKYNVFHIIVKPIREELLDEWETVAPGHIALIEDGNSVKYLAEVIISIMQITNGATKKDVIAQWGKKTDAGIAVAAAIETIDL